MNRKKPYIYKRVIAYFIDILIVTILSGILTIVLTDNTDYNNDTNKLLEITEKLTSGEITQEEYYKEFNEINYALTKDSTSVTIITVCVTIVYYVVMSYFCHGITLGKYAMKLKIISANKQNLNIFNYLLRSLIINNILSNVATVILISVLTKEAFINSYSKVSNVFTLILIISFIFMMYREDGRGLHDLLGNTKIVNLKDIDEKDEKIQDAEVIKETTKKRGSEE